jgi:hypothetical protein
MLYQKLEPMSKQLTIVVGLTVVGFMTFGLALSFYRNVLFEDTLRTIQGENDRLQKQIEDGHAELDYYQSAQYKDKYAKENLSKLNAGEKAIIITQQDGQGVLSITGSGAEAATRDAVYQEQLREMPVYLHWKLFLFGKDRLEELKKGL